MHNQPGAAPVFVDRTGRRRRLTVVAGTAMGVGLLTSLGLIAAGLFLDTSVTVPGWSDTRVTPPLEADVEGREELGADRGAPRPSPVTSTSVPSRTAAPVPSAAPTTPPTATGVPGRGDERRSTAKPSRSPGRPG